MLVINGNDNKIIKLSTNSYNISNNIIGFNLLNNTNISILSSNILIYNNNQLITTPTNFILNLNHGDNYIIKYSLILNNTISYSINIQTVDDISPIITLLGDNPMIINVGTSNFIDPGYQINDNSGNILTPIITGTVDTNNVGYYKIIYSATDLNNNIISKIRNVMIVNNIHIYRFAILDQQQNNYQLTRGRFIKFNNLNIINKLRKTINWTIECWFFIYNLASTNQNNAINSVYYTSGTNTLYPPSNSTNYISFRNTNNNYLFSLKSNNNNIFNIWFNSGDDTHTLNISINWNGSITTYSMVKFDTYPVYSNGWNHLAISYDSSIMRLFINGTILQYTYNLNNSLIGLSTMTNDSLYIGTNANDTDNNLLNNGVRFPGYISQLSISSYCKYMDSFIPSLDLIPKNINMCIFYLGNNYIDLVSNQIGTLFDNVDMTNSQPLLNRLTLYNYNLIYRFPGGILNNSYWCLHNNSLGNSWDNIDVNISNYNTNQDFSNGLSIAFNYFNITSNSWTGSNLYFISALFYIGPNPDNLNLPYLSLFRDSSNTSSLTLIYNNITYNINLNFPCNGSKMLITLNPNGIFSLYIASKLVYSRNINFNYNSIKNMGIWIGRYNNNNWYGGFSDIQIYNDIIPWYIAFQ